MADIALTADDVRRIFPDRERTYDHIAAATITRGQLVYINSSGKADLASAAATGTAQVVGMALKDAAAGQVVPVLYRGWVAGFTVSGSAYEARLYLSNTAGAMADAAGTVPVTIARVRAVNDNDLTKLVYFFTNPDNQYT